ncbi:MAG: hypothetical protein ACXWOH_12750 [Bdellovibrionota bacterium]
MITQSVPNTFEPSQVTQGRGELSRVLAHGCSQVRVCPNLSEIDLDGDGEPGNAFADYLMESAEHFDLVDVFRWS